MSDVEVITVRGDHISLDLLISRRYRTYYPGYLERVLDLNPGLAAQGPLLAVGTKVMLPKPGEAEVANAVKVLKLWE